MHRAGCTAHPTAAWVTQQARQLAWTMQEADTSPRFLIHDRDAKFPPTCDTVFASAGVAVICTPYRAPKANAYAERRVRAARADQIRRLLQRGPVALPAPLRNGTVRRRDRRGGLLHDDHREAA